MRGDGEYPVRRVNYDKKLTKKTARVQAMVTVFGSTEGRDIAYTETILGMNDAHMIVTLPEQKVIVRLHVSEHGMVYVTTNGAFGDNVLFVGSAVER